MPEPTARTRFRMVLLVVLAMVLAADFFFVRAVLPLERLDNREVSTFPVFRLYGEMALGTTNPDTTWPGQVKVTVTEINTSSWGWTPTKQTMFVMLFITMDDHSIPTAAERFRIGKAIADRRGETGVIDTLFRAGGGTHTKPLPWGYVHNAVAGLLAVGIVACIAGIVKDRVVAARSIRRSSRGLCVACGYPSPASGVCPECGKDAKVGA